jgi:hypothetical protein
MIGCHQRLLMHVERGDNIKFDRCDYAKKPQ